MSDDLNDDYGVVGLDDEDLMVPFFKNFSVEIGDFDCSRYFEPEGLDLLGINYLLGKFFKRFQIPGKQAPITVGMLQYAVALGRWDSSQIESTCLTDKDWQSND